MEKKKIVLPEALQKEIVKFFLKTSIPRLAKEKRENEEKQNKKALPNAKGQG